MLPFFPAGKNLDMRKEKSADVEPLAQTWKRFKWSGLDEALLLGQS
jgi:hypothetical protein